MIGSTSLAPGGKESGPVRVWLATSPVDMRRSFDALAEHVRVILAGDPLSGHLFVFRNRSAERVKILWWDGDGLCIYYKRLERGTFEFPSSGEKTVSVSSVDLMRLLRGVSLKKKENNFAG